MELKAHECDELETVVAMTVKTSVLWNVTQCSLVEVFRRFRGIYCSHFQG
jgi:hypothetical protein